MTSWDLPFDLGFPVAFATGDLWASSNDVYVSVFLDRPSEAAADTYEALMTSLVVLADTGALAGPRIAPSSSTIADRTLIERSGEAIRFVLRGCAVDEATTVLCANALSLGHAEFPIKKVVIGRSPAPAGGGAHGALTFSSAATDPYPRAATGLPFAVHLDPDMDAPTLSVAFRKALSAEASGLVRDNLLVWAAATTMGLYAPALTTPSESGASFSPSDLHTYGDEVQLQLYSFRCHAAALVGLVNVCAALHETVSEVRAVSAE